MNGISIAVYWFTGQIIVQMVANYDATVINIMLFQIISNHYTTLILIKLLLASYVTV